MSIHLWFEVVEIEELAVYAVIIILLSREEIEKITHLLTSYKAVIFVNNYK